MMNFLKKIKEKIKKPKIVNDNTSPTISNTPYEFTITNSNDNTEINLPEIKIIDPEKLCKNCKIEMKNKTKGFKYKGKDKPHRKVLVCGKCGFEKRLAR